MDCDTLRQRLVAAGCSESNYSIRCRNDDTYAIDCFEGEWWVFYTERGIVNEPEFRSPREAEACQYLWEKLQTMRHHHLAQTFSEPAERDAFLAWLTEHGIDYWCNDIPTPVLPSPLYRVFVFGTDISRVSELRAQEGTP